MRNKKRILLVDDNDDIITTYKVVLDRMGYEVEVLRDGVRAVETVETTLPDLVLLDVLLPGVSGLDVCRALKENSKTRDIPVVAITASVSADTRKKMQEAGADDFLLKPIDVSDLNRVMKQFL